MNSKYIISHVYRRKKCINEIIRDVISRTVAIIVSHPLEVISLRMMAQFVGGETKYRYHKYTIYSINFLNLSRRERIFFQLKCNIRRKEK